jgi:hypothetical protein
MEVFSWWTESLLTFTAKFFVQNSGVPSVCRVTPKESAVGGRGHIMVGMQGKRLFLHRKVETINGFGWKYWFR